MRQVSAAAVILYATGICFCSVSVQAETIRLSNGKTIEGKVVEETAEHIRIMDAAGYIYKYRRFEIETITSPEPSSFSAPESQEPSEQQTLKEAQGEIKGVRAQLEENLKQTEAMVQDTLRRLYALPEYQKTFGDYKESGNVTGKNGSGRLQEERDRKYRKYKKYY